MLKRVGGEFIKVMQQSESGTTLDSAFAIGTNQNLWVIQVRQHPVPAGVLPAWHVRDSHYKNIGNRAALPPSQRPSRITSGPGTPVVGSRSVARQTDGTRAHRAPF